MSYVKPDALALFEAEERRKKEQEEKLQKAAEFKKQLDELPPAERRQVLRALDKMQRKADKPESRRRLLVDAGQTLRVHNLVRHSKRYGMTQDEAVKMISKRVADKQAIEERMNNARSTRIESVATDSV
jgi:hypothetical protein